MKYFLLLIALVILTACSKPPKPESRWVCERYNAYLIQAPDGKVDTVLRCVKYRLVDSTH